MERVDSATWSAMQTKKPFATYKKTILGKIYVSVLSPFDNSPTGEILFGDPRTSEEALIDVWTEKEDRFFNQKNKRQFEVGNIIKFERPEDIEEREQQIEQYSDEQLTKVLNSKFFSLRKTVDEVESKAVMFRLIDLGRGADKSEKIMKTLEARLAYLQAVDIGSEEE